MRIVSVDDIDHGYRLVIDQARSQLQLQLQRGSTPDPPPLVETPKIAGSPTWMIRGFFNT